MHFSQKHWQFGKRSVWERLVFFHLSIHVDWSNYSRLRYCYKYFSVLDVFRGKVWRANYGLCWPLLFIAGKLHLGSLVTVGQYRAVASKLYKIPSQRFCLAVSFSLHHPTILCTFFRDSQLNESYESYSDGKFTLMHQKPCFGIVFLYLGALTAMAQHPLFYMKKNAWVCVVLY